MGFFSDVKLFMKYADVEFRPSPGNKLFQAVENNDLESVKRILVPNLLGPDFDWTDAVIKMDTLTLSIPCIQGNIAIANELLKAGIPVKTRDSKNLSALEYAISHNQYEIVKLLINHGAKVNTRIGSYGRTPLFIAVNESKDIEMVKILIDAGARINVREDNGFPPAAFAVLHNLTDILRLFINLGIDVNERIGSSNITLLENAILDNSSIEVIELLLQSGADPYLKDNQNRCAIDMAKEKNNREIINLLTEKSKYQV
jgi:ankyrin repeat protein